MRNTLLTIVIIVVLAAPQATACTGVVISQDGRTVVGGNEDWYRASAFYWATAAVGSLHGVVYFGYLVDGEFGDMPPFWWEFQGINDAGLFFDSLSTPCGIDPEEADKRSYTGRIERLIMQTCSTVSEAVDVITRYDRTFMDCRQYLLADRTGAAAVVEPDKVVWMEAGTMALTNFRLSDPSLGQYPCWRYEAVTDELAINREPTVDRVAEILSAAENPSTQYTVVSDLGSNTAYVYRIGDYSRQYQIDLEPLWTNGSDHVSFSALRLSED